MSEILRIARSSSSVVIIYEKASALIISMEKQGENSGKPIAIYV